MAEENIHIIKLCFDAPLHIHNERADYAESVSRLYSDVIYAALTQVASMFEHKKRLFNWDTGEPNFTISSAFPFTTEEGYTHYFLPRPFKAFDRTNQNNGEWHRKEKNLKAIEWLDLDIYTEHLSLEKGVEVNPRDWLHGAYMSKTKITPFVTTQLEPKVSISRKGEDAEPYYLERLYFQKDSGLYLIFKGENSLFEIFKELMTFLGQEGVGTDRSSGNGTFSIIEETTPSVLAQFKALFSVESKYSTNLSLYCPRTKDELNEGLKSDNVGYSLIKRGGWITTEKFNTYRKKGSYFFGEGSVFSYDTKEKGNSIGNTINLAPDIIKSKKVWRAGKSLFVPIKMI